MKGDVKDNLLPLRDGVTFLGSATASHLSLPLPRWSCTSIDLYHTSPLHPIAICTSINLDLSSCREFESTSAVALLTTDLSEAFSLSLYSVMRGGLEIMVEPSMSWPTGLIEAHPRPCVSSRNQLQSTLTRSDRARDALCRVHEFHFALVVPFSFFPKNPCDDCNLPRQGQKGQGRSHAAVNHGIEV